MQNLHCILDRFDALYTGKEQDLGIPSKFPFKDQILAEVAQAKNQVCRYSQGSRKYCISDESSLQRELEKQLRREQQKAAHQAASLGLANPAPANEDEELGGDSDDFETDDSMDEDDDEADDNAAAESSSSLKLHARSLRDVISKSDVIVQVLDARDPEGTRSRKIEREAVQVHGKKLVLVLNKIGGAEYSLSMSHVLTIAHYRPDPQGER